ncbi:unnamed protein product, partial [Linum tenue]
AALGSGLGRSSTDTSGSQTPIDIFSGFSAPAPQRILGPATWTRRDKYRTANNPAPATTTSIRPYKSRFPLRIREKDAAPHAILLALPHPPSMVKRMPPIVTPSGKSPLPHAILLEFVYMSWDSDKKETLKFLGISIILLAIWVSDFVVGWGF